MKEEIDLLFEKPIQISESNNSTLIDSKMKAEIDLLFETPIQISASIKPDAIFNPYTETIPMDEIKVKNPYASFTATIPIESRI